MRQLLDLCGTFARVGLLTIGGGYAMLPMLQREVVDSRHWVTEEELLDVFAIGQCTPGIIAINVATFVGFRQRKIPGAIAATLGMVLPSLVVLSIVALVLENFLDYPAVQHAFAGIRVAVVVLIAATVIRLLRTGVKGAWAAAATVLAFFLTVLFALSPVWIVLGAAVLGVILGLVRLRKAGAGQ